MKWVWNEFRNCAVNLSYVEGLLISGEKDEWTVEAIIPDDPVAIVLGTYKTREAAQEFVSNLTQAAWAGNGQKDNDRLTCGCDGYYQTFGVHRPGCPVDK